jgi:hypothetical protein
MVLVVIGVLLVWQIPTIIWRIEPPIRVGLLHSQSGPLASSEQSMIDGEVLALEEINTQGGLLGRRIEWVIADGRSDWPTFAQRAQQLIRDEKVSVIFGCWASASRKTVEPIIERFDHLLFYPNAYEGLELSPNIVYTGAAVNQQVVPAVKWTCDHMKARRYSIEPRPDVVARASSPYQRSHRPEVRVTHRPFPRSRSLRLKSWSGTGRRDRSCRRNRQPPPSPADPIMTRRV